MKPFSGYYFFFVIVQYFKVGPPVAFFHQAVQGFCVLLKIESRDKSSCFRIRNHFLCSMETVKNHRNASVGQRFINHHRHSFMCGGETYDFWFFVKRFGVLMSHEKNSFQMIFFGYFFQVFSVFSVTDNIETPIGMDRLKFFPYTQQPVYSFVSITEAPYVKKNILFCTGR